MPNKTLVCKYLVFCNKVFRLEHRIHIILVDIVFLQERHNRPAPLPLPVTIWCRQADTIPQHGRPAAGERGRVPGDPRVPAERGQPVVRLHPGDVRPTPQGDRLPPPGGAAAAAGPADSGEGRHCGPAAARLCADAQVPGQDRSVGRGAAVTGPGFRTNRPGSTICRSSFRQRS